MLNNFTFKKQKKKKTIFRDLETVMPNVLVQVKADLKATLDEIGAPPMPSEIETILDGQILDLVNPEHKIRYLVSK